MSKIKDYLIEIMEDGDDVIIPIPDEILDELGLVEGDELEITQDEEENAIILTPVKNKKKAATENEAEVSNE